jgi:predicted nucleic acid-binding protein
MKALDTSFLVDYFAEPPQGAAGRWLAEHEDDPLGTPTLCLNEVYRGATIADGADTVEDLARGLEWAEPLPFTEASAREAAVVEGELQAAGTPINQMDVLIAGVVRDLGAAIVTNDSHFEAVDGLDVIRYDEAPE